MKTRSLPDRVVATLRARLSQLGPQLTPHLTRTRLIVFACTLIAIGFALGGLERSEPPVEATLTTQQMVLDLPKPVNEPVKLPSVPAVAVPATGAAAATAAGLDTTPPPAAENWDAVTVKRGQTLDRIFRDQGFSIPLLHDIINLDDDTARLTRIRPGDQFEFQRHPDGSMKRMRYALDEATYLLIDSGPEGAFAAREGRELFREVAEAEGQIESSLFLAAKAAGMSDAMTMQLANIFGWDIDFVLDIREGDRFFLVYEKVYRDGQYLRDGDILAATFINRGQRFQAIRHEQDGVAAYFSPDGRPMKKAFLRAPLNFSYVSSRFNPKRFHPVLRRVKPHNGIDYSAPVGTPVYAAGKGRVTRSAYDKYNGHHVFIQHAGSIVTKYLHFTRRAVKKNQSVQQGQVIGYVGSTGMSTAPHLHYEFLVNGVHRNPGTVPLPKAEPLEGEVLAGFRTAAAPLQNRLSRLESASLYAARE